MEAITHFFKWKMKLLINILLSANHLIFYFIAQNEECVCLCVITRIKTIQRFPRGCPLNFFISAIFCSYWTCTWNERPFNCLKCSYTDSPSVLYQHKWNFRVIHYYYHQQCNQLPESDRNERLHKILMKCGSPKFPLLAKLLLLPPPAAQ